LQEATTANTMAVKGSEFAPTMDPVSEVDFDPVHD